MLGNFKELRDFKLSRINQPVKSVIINGKVRPVDGHDGNYLPAPLFAIDRADF